MAGTIIPNPGILNGPMYKAARFSAEYVNVPPSFHRLSNALGLTAGLFAGRKMMDIMVGETPDGKKVERDDLAKPLQMLHGILHYDHFSDAPKERWMKVFDRLVPAVTGAMGACAGSGHFFSRDFIKPTQQKIILGATKPESLTLFDGEKMALFHQSQPWNILTGTSALFGSASGAGLFPSIMHYGSDLGTLFAMRAERAAAPLGKLVNSNARMPFRPTKATTNLIAYAAGNPSVNPEMLNEYANGILKTWFRGVKPEQVEAFVKVVNEEREKFVEAGHVPAHAEAAVKASLGKLLQTHGIEDTLIQIGLDPREASLGDQGFISVISRKIGDALGMGTSKKLEETWKQIAKGVEHRHPELVSEPFDIKAHQFAPTLIQKTAAVAAIGAGVGVIGMISGAKDADVGDVAKENAIKTPHSGGVSPDIAQSTVTSFTHKVTGHRHALHTKKNNGVINGKVLDAAEGITDTFNVINGVNSHRLYAAAGLSAGSWIGEEFMKALTGVTFAGAKVAKEDVLKPFQKIYKAAAFNPHSDLPNDKWMQVVRWIVPTAIGGAAVVQASQMYFRDREKKNKNATYLDEVEQKVTSAQAAAWTPGAAVTALFGGSSGFAWVPGINYMTHLGTRYSMASGRKVSLPHVGKAWSNNSTLFPFSPPGMIDMLIKEAVNNKAESPELLETYAIGALKPWFDNITPAQIEEFVNKVYEIRDQYYKDGGVPEDLKNQLTHIMDERLKGAGLEGTLREIGLNPLDADIGSNGLSGKIAESTGARKKIEQIKSDYKASYVERLQHQQQNHESEAGYRSLSE